MKFVVELAHIGTNFKVRMVLIDTIAGVWRPPDDFETEWSDGMSVTRRKLEEGFSERMRYYSLPSGDAREPSLTYWPQTQRGPRLRFEVSLPKLLDMPPVVLGTVDVGRGLDRINEFLALRGISAPDVREWRCVRLDVCYAWWTGRDTPVYISALGQQQLGNYQRVPFGPTGVVWKSGRGYRWIKFYDKLKELGCRDMGVLRYEVSAFGNGVRDIMRRGMPRRKKDALPAELHEWVSVGWLTAPSRVHVELVRWLERLRVVSDRFGPREALLARLIGEFGSSGAASALYFLEVYSKYGIAAYKPPLELISDSTFFRWRLKLEKAGLLVNVDDFEGLPGLVVPEDGFGAETIGREWMA